MMMMMMMLAMVDDDGERDVPSTAAIPGTAGAEARRGDERLRSLARGEGERLALETQTRATVGGQPDSARRRPSGAVFGVFGVHA